MAVTRGEGFGPEILPVKNALLSLTERGGAVELARALHERGATLWATEGTARALEAAGLPVRAVSELVGQGAWLGGRVKTLHPALLGGVLARRDVPGDRADLEEREIPPIDLVVVTLYAFEEVPESARWDEAVEKIDVGGDTVTFTFAPIHKTVRAQLEGKRAWVEQIAAAVAGRRMTVTVREGEASPTPTRPAPTDADRAARKAELAARAKEEPSVQAVLDVFGGEIEDVEEMQ